MFPELELISLPTRDRARGILRNAELVMQTLEEARLAQEKARESIDTANRDINSIGSDLQEV